MHTTMDRIRLWLGFFSRISYRRDFPLVLQAFRHRRRFSIPDHIWSKIIPIGGFLSVKEAGLLYWAACEWPVAGPVIELGSYKGRSTGVFALASRQVYAVDAWSLDVSDPSAYGQGIVAADAILTRFRSNLQRLQIENMVSVYRGLTHQVGQAWTIQGAILFVDAGHTYEDVRGDLEIWTRHLHPRGLLLMHDVLGDTYLDVTRAASELLQSGWRVVASAGSIVAFTRI
jgi:hypothetical protein